MRGSQVSFRFEHGYAAMQALIDQGVIGDFRAPDIMRFGITPLENDCMSKGCAVRRACPVSQSYGRMEDQSAFHMRAFK